MSNPIILGNFIISLNQPFGSWLVKENDITIGQFENYEDAELFANAKIHGVVIIGEREKVPGLNENEKISINI